MAGITISRTDLAGIIGQEISPERFDAVSTLVRGLLRSEYRRDISLAEGRDAEVLNAVFVSACVRILSNPAGARSITVGGASITFGGSDSSISDPAVLSETERELLRKLRRSRPAVINLSTPGYYPRYDTEPFVYRVV